MNHVLETNPAERDYFQRCGTSERAAYRRAVQACTGGLPVWGQRLRGGVPATFDVAAAVALYRTGELSLKAVGDRFGVTAQAIRHHVVKTQA